MEEPDKHRSWCSASTEAGQRAKGSRRAQGRAMTITSLHATDGDTAMVNLTGGNRSGLTGYRSNRSGPVPVSTGTQPAKIQILNLNSKNEKFLKNS